VDLFRFCSGHVNMDAHGMATPFTGQNTRTIWISWHGPNCTSVPRLLGMANLTGITVI
jgi:hypothetical protein